jgi:hypothetical protein
VQYTILGWRESNFADSSPLDASQVFRGVLDEPKYFPHRGFWELVVNMDLRRNTHDILSPF